VTISRPPPLPRLLAPLGRWYVIYRILTDHTPRPVLYGSSNTEVAFIAHPGSSVPLQVVPFKSFRAAAGRLADTGAVAIADSFLPPGLPLNTLVISSPGRMRREGTAPQNTLNVYGDVLYMPVPSEEEVMDLARVAFPGLIVGAELERTKRLLQLWGPNPRWVLENRSATMQRKQVKAALQVTREQLERAVTLNEIPPSSGDDVAHRILQEPCDGQVLGLTNKKSPTYYDGPDLRVSTPAWARYVARMSAVLARWVQAKFMDGSAGIGILGAARGNLMEVFALRLLEQGSPSGKLPVRALSSSQTSKSPVHDWPIPPLRRVEYETHKQLSEAITGATAPTLLVPTQRNWAGCDAVIFVPGDKAVAFVDVTVSQQHGIHAKGLHDTMAGQCAAALGWEGTGAISTTAPRPLECSCQGSFAGRCSPCCGFGRVLKHHGHVHLGCAGGRGWFVDGAAGEQARGEGGEGRMGRRTEGRGGRGCVEEAGGGRSGQSQGEVCCG